MAAMSKPAREARAPALKKMRQPGEQVTPGAFAFFEKQAQHRQITGAVALPPALTRRIVEVASELVPVAAQGTPHKSEKQSDPWHTFSPVGLALVSTVGNLFALAAAASHDHLALRALAGSASCCVFAFNMLMPKPLKLHQKTAGGWGLAFAILHFANFCLLLRESQGVKLSDEEECIYESSFQRFGVTPRQFRMLLNAGAQFKDLAPGEVLVHGGKPVDRVMFVVAGTCGAERDQGVTYLEYHQDVFVGELMPARWRAEYQGCPVLLSQAEEDHDSDWEDQWLIEHAEASARRLKRARPDSRRLLTDSMAQNVCLTKLQGGSAWAGTVRAGQSGCRVLVWPLGLFTNTVGADDKLCKSMEQIDELGLASKISAGGSRKILNTYRELLELVVADGRIPPEQKHALHRYRSRHAVPDAEHFRMLEKLGWSQGEYDDGILNSKWASVSRLWRQSHSSKP